MTNHTETDRERLEAARLRCAEYKALYRGRLASIAAGEVLAEVASETLYQLQYDLADEIEELLN